MTHPIQGLLDRFGNEACASPAVIANPAKYPCFVRMHDYVDADVPSSANDDDRDRKTAIVWDKLRMAQDKLARAAGIHSSGVCEIDKIDDVVGLYPRFWVENKTPSRQWGKSAISDPAKVDDGKFSFTVATFNTLARGLSSGPADLFPAPFAREDLAEPFEIYGGFSSVRSPEIVLDFDVRKWRLLHVLLGGGLRDGIDGDSGATAHHWSRPAYDILALEEVDEYNSFFRPLLLNDVDVTEEDRTTERFHFINGYHGVFQPKPHSPCIPLGWYSDGVALFWNPDKFQTIARPSSLENHDADDIVTWIERGSFDGKLQDCDHDEINISNLRNQVYVIVPLQLKDSDKCLVVAATHLKAKKGLHNERIREAQATELRQRTEKMASELVKQGRSDVGILIVGDFNSESNDTSVRCILSQEGRSTNCAKWLFQSAYPLQDTDSSRENSLYTSWKIRGDEISRRIIDYIFYASRSTVGEKGGEGLHCTHYLSVPNDSEVENDRFPGFRYPSDHLLIAAKFVY
ncbi:hypothetical protein ACHAXA_006494 [Cyclostephanos tholiformis]|jgi:mRNA deadenylase 3'-5' endonuclease subunit Ccr4|uniref:Endonuclease/exonuclease/phosphatase domain-containing protein n=1 Tax=Cyclostephanos tholiformis TaxID=382380 RepID=A0ABD3RZF6_9STRA